MKLKLDENLSRHLKSQLITFGHDVSTAAEERLLGQVDSAIAKAAKAENRIILTLDVGFANMRSYPPGSHPGIILFRPSSMGPISTNRFIVDFIVNSNIDLLSGCLVVVEPNKVRIRRPQ